MNSLEKVGVGRRISRGSSYSLGRELGIVCCVPVLRQMQILILGA